MKNIIIVLLMLSVTISACQKGSKADSNILERTNPKEVNITTPDGIKLYADLYHKDKSISTILLFHQGGSNVRGEYRRILPELLKRESNILAVDLRLGGQAYGSFNRSLAQLPDYNPFTDTYGYCDAYNNLEASLDYLINRGYSEKIIVWGSSYSAALAIQLGAKRGEDIAKVLAFSPPSSDAMKDCKPISYFAQLKIPTLLVRPDSEMGSQTVLIQLDSAKKHNIQTYVAKNGIHGSSLLDSVRTGFSTKDSWDRVNTFLEK